jgi:hypothetical protein
MSTYIGPFTNSLIDGVVKEFKKKEMKEKIIKHIIDPLMCDLSARYYPYFISIILFLILIIIMLATILILTIINGKSYKTFET